MGRELSERALQLRLGLVWKDGNWLVGQGVRGVLEEVEQEVEVQGQV
jgi:hypothetical protein